MSYRSVVLGDGPEAYWRLGESSGVVAADETGNGHDGTYVNGPLLGEPGLVVADLDTSVGLNGLNEHVDVPAGLGVDAYTVELWFDLPVAVDKNSAPESLVNLNSSFDAVYLGDSTASFTNEIITIADGGGGRSAWTSDTASIPAGTHHLVAVWDGAKYDFTLDGVVLPTTVAGVPLLVPADNVEIGRRSNGDFYFEGLVDEVAIYAVALTAAQISNHYTVGLGASTWRERMAALYGFQQRSP